MLSSAGEKENSHSDGGEVVATKVVEGGRKAAFEVDGALLSHTWEMGPMMTSILSCSAHLVNVCEQAMYFERRRCRMTMCFLM